MTEFDAMYRHAMHRADSAENNLRWMLLFVAVVFVSELILWATGAIEIVIAPTAPPVYRDSAPPRPPIRPELEIQECDDGWIGRFVIPRLKSAQTQTKPNTENKP